MLHEQLHVRQVPGEPRRRWFLSDQLDLILWLADDGGFAGFELCYDRKSQERSLMWRPDSGFAHRKVEDDRAGRHMATPLLVADDHVDIPRLHAAFAREAVSLPEEVSRYVLGALERHPAFARPATR